MDSNWSSVGFGLCVQSGLLQVALFGHRLCDFESRFDVFLILFRNFDDGDSPIRRLPSCGREKVE